MQRPHEEAEEGCHRIGEAGRRQFLTRTIAAIHAAIGGTLGVIVVGAVLSPSVAARQETWLTAGTLDDLADNEPTPVMLRITRQDGYTHVVDRRVVFLVKGEGSVVTALDSTCTHLGCRVSWNGEAQELQCPCHGGRFDRHGSVIAGPPPAPLARFRTRLEAGQILVHV